MYSPFDVRPIESAQHKCEVKFALTPLDQLLEEVDTQHSSSPPKWKRGSEIFIIFSFADCWLLPSRWIKGPQSFLVCEVATSEARSCLLGFSFCADRTLKIDVIHQCNPSSISSFLCDSQPCHFRCKHLIWNHYVPARGGLLLVLTFLWGLFSLLFVIAR